MSPFHRFLLLLAVSAVSVAGQCIPECDEDCTGGDLVSDPMNCRRYYVCLDDCTISDVPFECDEGFKFDNETGSCKDEAAESVTCAFCEPKCTFTCPEDGDISFAADPTDCTHYFLCGMGPPQTLVCPDGQYFDGEDCQEDQAACCDPCTVFCETAYTEIANPYDCTKFYLCTQEKYYPEEEDLLDCPVGQNFNSSLGHCSAAASCQQPCAPALRGS